MLRSLHLRNMAEADTEAVVVAVPMAEAEVVSTVAVEAADPMEAVLAEEVERIAAADRTEAIAVGQVAQAEVWVPTGAALPGMRRADTAAELTAVVPTARTADVRRAVRRMRVTAVPDRMRGVRIH